MGGSARLTIIISVSCRIQTARSPEKAGGGGSILTTIESISYKIHRSLVLFPFVPKFGFPEMLSPGRFVAEFCNQGPDPIRNGSSDSHNPHAPMNALQDAQWNPESHVGSLPPGLRPCDMQYIRLATE